MTPQPPTSTLATHWTRLHRRLGRYGGISRGLLLCVTIALAATFIADHYGGPALLYSLLFGTALNFLSDEGGCRRGVDFASRTVLRLGVALLGARITLEQIGQLGFGPLFLVMGAVAFVILAGLVLARVLGLRKELGLLTGGAVGICGASAALALSAVMPRTGASERNTIVTVIGVTVLSTVAMVVYPLIAVAAALTDTQAGILLGGTIHDVAQAVGAGYMLSEPTGDTATVVKLLRVAMLVPVVVIFAWFFRESSGLQRSKGRIPMLPGFLVGFILLVMANSAGVFPELVTQSMAAMSGWCLVIAIAALGVKTSIHELAEVGWKPVTLMVIETVLLLTLIITIVAIGGVGAD